MSDAPTLPAATRSASWSDLHVALWNALKLGASLIGTWTVALAVRFALPRQLGPDQYGVYNFAEAFAASFFVLTTLGIETYVQKEIPLRREHASDFVGGVVALRVALGTLLLAAMAIILHFDGRAVEIRYAVYLFAVGQIFFVANATLSALLHASGTVDGLSIVNIAAKLLWGTGMVAAIVTRSGVAARAAPGAAHGFGAPAALLPGRIAIGNGVDAGDAAVARGHPHDRGPSQPRVGNRRGRLGRLHRRSGVRARHPRASHPLPGVHRDLRRDGLRRLPVPRGAILDGDVGLHRRRRGQCGSQRRADPSPARRARPRRCRRR